MLALRTQFRHWKLVFRGGDRPFCCVPAVSPVCDPGSSSSSCFVGSCWCKESISLLILLLKSDLFGFFFLKLNPTLAPFQNGSPFHQPPLGKAATGHQGLSWLYHTSKEYHHFLSVGSLCADCLSAVCLLGSLGYFGVRQVGFAPLRSVFIISLSCFGSVWAN